MIDLSIWKHESGENEVKVGKEAVIETKEGEFVKTGRKMWFFCCLSVGISVLLSLNVESASFRLRWWFQARVKSWPGKMGEEQGRSGIVSVVLIAFTKHPGASGLQTPLTGGGLRRVDRRAAWKAKLNAALMTHRSISFTDIKMAWRKSPAS